MFAGGEGDTGWGKWKALSKRKITSYIDFAVAVAMQIQWEMKWKNIVSEVMPWVNDRVHTTHTHKRITFFFLWTTQNNKSTRATR